VLDVDLTGIVGRMTQADHDALETSSEQTLNDALGIAVTEEGRERGRRRLAEFREQWPAERFARVRAKYGVERRTA
jgi:hypothetical protein